MNKLRILPWLLAGSMALTACGGGNNSATGDASSASSSAAASLPPAQSVMAPLPAVPDGSEPDPAASLPGDGSTSSVEPDASQAPASSQVPEAPPAVVAKPSKPVKPEKPSKPSKPQPQDAPDSSTQPPESSAGQTPADPEPEPEPKPAPTKADAQAYIGKSVSSLIAAIGSPKGSDYAPSCLGDGEDGELFYDGFTVYTYRANGTETVQDVV